MPASPASSPARPPRGAQPIRHESADLEGAFFAALAGGDAGAAVAALLDLDAAIEARIRGGEDSPDLDNARSTFRSLIVRLGEAAAAGGSDPRATVEPFVEALLAVRARARETRDWATADLVRDRLAEAGVEVRDGAEGSTWVLGSSPSGPESRPPRRASNAATSASSIPAAKIGHGYGPGRP